MSSGPVILRDETSGALIIIRDPVTFDCGFCGVTCVAGIDNDGYGAVLHKEPPCQTYQDNEPDDFLELSRKRKEH